MNPFQDQLLISPEYRARALLTPNADRNILTVNILKLAKCM